MLIAFVGVAGCGKNTACDIMYDAYDTTTISFAEPVKDAVAAVFRWPRYLLEGDTLESRTWRDTPDSFWSKEFGCQFTPRDALQSVGTDLFRNMFYGGIWVATAKRRIMAELAEGNSVTVSDTRFVNEMQMIKSLGGKIFWIRRPSTEPEWLKTFDELQVIPDSSEVHPSETDFLRRLDLIDGILYNDGSIDDFEEVILGAIDGSDTTG